MLFRSGKNRSTPEKIDYFVNERISVLKVAAGTRFSVVLDSYGTIYTFGCNAVKECGKIGERFGTPSKIDMFFRDHIKGFDIYAGYSNAACITSIL